MKSKTILIIVLAIILSGFVFALIINFSPIGSGACTEMACSCKSYNEKTEIPCNSCGKTTFFYATFILNIGKSCNAKQIIICENGDNIGERFGDYTDCKYYISIFGNKIN
jgi:hypothetical protein